jgi:tRNA threonylcarbamoyladenosine biosynthesis protein TsaE
MPTTIETRSPDDTAAVGERLGGTLGAGTVVALTGELGAGKTCFVQGLVRGLGVVTRATSPTFVFVNEYRGRVPVHHVDLYRAEGLDVVEALGVPSLFDRESVTVVEWADRLGPLVPPDAIRVHIEGVGDEPRRITIDTSILRPDAPL